MLITRLLSLALILNLSNLPGLAAQVYRVTFANFTAVERSLMKNHLERTIGKVKNDKGFYVADFEWIKQRTQQGDIMVAKTEGTEIDLRQELIWVLVDDAWVEVPAFYIQIPNGWLEQFGNADIAIQNIIVHEFFHVIDPEAPHKQNEKSVFSGGLNQSKLEWTKADKDWVLRRLRNEDTGL